MVQKWVWHILPPVLNTKIRGLHHLGPFLVHFRFCFICIQWMYRGVCRLLCKVYKNCILTYKNLYTKSVSYISASVFPIFDQDWLDDGVGFQSNYKCKGRVSWTQGRYPIQKDIQRGLIFILKGRGMNYHNKTHNSIYNNKIN